MAFTTDDFDKIWASTSPLTPYEFSDSNYQQGWNFIGSTPPARQMWDFLQKRNDEKTQWLYNNKVTGTEATESHTISSINAGEQTSFTISNTPKYYSVSMSGTGFANMLVTKGSEKTFYVVNVGSLDRTNITVTVNYIY